MIRQRKEQEFWAVAGVAMVFWVICCGLLLWRYFNFYPTYVSFDQGIFNQVFWNSLHGRFFESSLSSTESTAVLHQSEVPTVYYHRLGQHFTPALMLWLPWYALLQSPAGLSVLQVTLVAAAGLLLYALARHYHSPQVAAWLAIAYFCAGAVIGPTLANFHDICQIPLFVFGLLLAMERRQWSLFWLLSGLVLLVREDAGIVLFSVGFYLLVSRRFPLVGSAVCILSFGYILALTNWIMPMFSADISSRFMVEQFGQFVGGQEASTLEVMGAIARQPLKMIEELLTPVDRTISYLLAQWLPLAFVPSISASAWALIAFPLTKTLLRQDPIALAMDLRYAMILVPGLFYGAILWWAKHPGFFQPRIRKLWAFCLGLSLLLTVVSNPNRALSFVIPDSFQPWVHVSPLRQWQHADAVRSLLSQIPPDASVSATTHLVPHLSNRREVVRFPELRLRNDAREVISVEYVVLDFWYLKQFQVVFDDDRETLNQISQEMSELLQQKNYGLIGFQDGVALLQKNQPAQPDAMESWLSFQQELEAVLRSPQE